MKEGLERSLRNYVAVADIFRGATKCFFGDPIPENIYETWRLLLAAMRLTDYRVDNLVDSEERTRFLDETIIFLSGKTEGYKTGDGDLDRSIYRLRNALEQFPEENRDYFFSKARAYCIVMQRGKVVTDAHKFAFFRRLEGQIASRLFTALLPNEHSNTQKRSRFDKWLQRVGRAANCFDSFIDLPGDAALGEVAIIPSIKNRLFLLAAGITDATYIFSRSSPPLLKDIAIATIGTWQNNSRK